jgi:hypothetical protein
MGEALKLVHDIFRRELALIRDEFTKPDSPLGAQHSTRHGTRLGAQLRVNCLTLCQGLHQHHTGEDLGIFTFLADRRPDLAPTLDRLRDEHRRIAVLVEELRRVIGERDAEPARVLPEVVRLTDELEAHLTYEEEQLIPVLNAAPAP